MSLRLDRNAQWYYANLIRDVGTSAWISVMGYARGAILLGGTGAYELTFAVRGAKGDDPAGIGLFTPKTLVDGAGNVIGLSANGGEAKELPPSIFLFHSFRINFEPTATTGNPVGLVLSA